MFPHKPCSPPNHLPAVLPPTPRRSPQWPPCAHAPGRRWRVQPPSCQWAPPPSCPSALRAALPRSHCPAPPRSLPPPPRTAGKQRFGFGSGKKGRLRPWAWVRGNRRGAGQGGAPCQLPCLVWDVTGFVGAGEGSASKSSLCPDQSIRPIKPTSPAPAPTHKYPPTHTGHPLCTHLALRLAARLLLLLLGLLLGRAGVQGRAGLSCADGQGRWAEQGRAGQMGRAGWGSTEMAAQETAQEAAQHQQQPPAAAAHDSAAPPRAQLGPFCTRPPSLRPQYTCTCLSKETRLGAHTLACRSQSLFASHLSVQQDPHWQANQTTRHLGRPPCTRHIRTQSQSKRKMLECAHLGRLARAAGTLALGGRRRRLALLGLRLRYRGGSTAIQHEGWQGGKNRGRGSRRRAPSWPAPAGQHYMGWQYSREIAVRWDGGILSPPCLSATCMLVCSRQKAAGKRLSQRPHPAWPSTHLVLLGCRPLLLGLLLGLLVRLLLIVSRKSQQVKKRNDSRTQCTIGGQRNEASAGPCLGWVGGRPLGKTERDKTTNTN